MKYARAPSALRSNDFAFLSPLTNIQPFPLLILSFSLIEYSKLLVLQAPPSLALALALASIDVYPPRLALLETLQGGQRYYHEFP